MRFDTTFKPWNACSRDGSRPVLTHVNLTIEGESAWLDASDSYCLVRVPCEIDEGDTAGLILVDALKHAAKIASKPNHAEIACGEKCETLDGYAWPRPEGKAPNATSILKGTPALGKDLDCGEFGINGALLNKIASAMGARNGVRVRCANPLKPIIVDPLGIDDGRIGIVVPIRIS